MFLITKSITLPLPSPTMELDCVDLESVSLSLYRSSRDSSFENDPALSISDNNIRSHLSPTIPSTEYTNQNELRPGFRVNKRSEYISSISSISQVYLKYISSITQVYLKYLKYFIYIFHKFIAWIDLIYLWLREATYDDFDDHKLKL